MRIEDDIVDLLNQLRDAVNAQFGYWQGQPRINLGPCGRFAKVFYDRWNARFEDKVTITFLMRQGGDYCYHVLVRLPDGRYYDGGNGVMSAEQLLATIDDGYDGQIEEMPVFDLATLEARSYGLTRTYRACPNYSDDVVAELVETCLHRLTASMPRETVLSGSASSAAWVES
jgi:hypothetical protein